MIANAMDAAPTEVRADGVDREITTLAAFALEPEEVDLRNFFSSPAQVTDELASYHLLWLRGGNTFMLRYALAHSGADVPIRRLIADDAVVYGGYSAGACVLAPSLRGLETVDNPQAVPDTYRDAVIWEGLGILDYAIVPHIDSPEHPDSAEVRLLAQHYTATGIPHRTMRDGQVLIIDGDQHDLCG